MVCCYVHISNVFYYTGIDEMLSEISLIHHHHNKDIKGDTCFV
jgi:hypothetical protein